MTDLDFLIPRKYPGYSLKPPEADLLTRHAIACQLAVRFLHAQLQTLLHKPTDESAGLLPSVNIDSQSIRKLRKDYPGRYRLHSDVATYLLPTVFDAAVKEFAKAEASGQSFQPYNYQATLMSLIKVGANPLGLLSSPSLSAKELDGYLQYWPGNKQPDDEGFTLGHARCLHVDFVSAILPVLLKYKTNINSQAKILPVGTFTHIMLANEFFEEALALVRSPSIRNLLDPSKTDGEGKTVPIIAAKVRAQDILLSLADLFPQKLGLSAQDAEGRTVMHYCFGLGLIDATRRYMELDPDLSQVDKLGRTAPIYLDLTAKETAGILYSIEIHAGRDAGARHNSIYGTSVGKNPVLVRGLPQLNTKQNFTPELATAARDQFGDASRKLLELQYRQLRGVSLLQQIMTDRAKLKIEHKNGLLHPTPGSGRSGGRFGPNLEA